MSKEIEYKRREGHSTDGEGVRFQKTQLYSFMQTPEQNIGSLPFHNP